MFSESARLQTLARGKLTLLSDYKSNKEQLSHLPEYEMDAALSTPIKKRILDNKDAEGINAAYHTTDQDISTAMESSEPQTTIDVIKQFLVALGANSSQP